ncbi:hypothetical protein DMN91_003071 [Ooceraea biroi]|uniref:39S ribosomal protein L13, mitochondrial n=1 Tax=Ooceraea biroi TaxID=2015173 RepID=A0A3L8DYF1_OOCBI|nr:hypothetical protein DMN91_003071 [Ooceraea biroi]
MSLVRRGQQWGTFARIWHMYDATWQDPYKSAEIIKFYLMGLYKPIYHPLNESGDHVVVINSKEIALRGDEWRKRVYFHHTTYHGGASWTLAWELHNKDPTLVTASQDYNIYIYICSVCVCVCNMVSLFLLNTYIIICKLSIQIVKKAVYGALPKNLQRRHIMQRLHIFPNNKVPDDILKNITSQIRQLRDVPVRLDHIPQEEVDNFPQLLTYPKNYILK